jgi:integrase
MKSKYLTKAIRCPDGTRKYIRAHTPDELERKVRDAQVQLGLGININDKTTLADFSQVWLNTYRKPALKDQSFAVLSGNVSNHITPVIGHKLVRDIKSADCAIVLNNISDLSRSTQSAVISAMRSIFDCAVENNLVSRNPVSKNLRPVAEVSATREPLTRSQMDKLLHVALSHKDQYMGLFILLCGWCGLREGEVLGLNWDSVSLDEGIIHVKEQYLRGVGVSSNLKTVSSNRKVPIPPPVESFLRSFSGVRTGYIFDVSLSRLDSVYYKKMQRLSTTRNALLDFTIHPHILRHTYATRCIESGIDPKTVQYLMGHSTAKVTMNIYTHYQEEERRRKTAALISEAFPLNSYC